MKVPRRFQLGVATHTGVVRSTNEDDYFLLAPPNGQPCLLLAAVADGMGGVTGGAEASRSGLRGFASGLLAAKPGDLDAAVRRAFDTACRRVHEQARAVPALRDMGTTLTALAFGPDAAVLGHICDSRAFRLRGNRLEQLTTDHASREQQNRLLRVIGGGQSAEVPDLEVLELQPGDRFLLCSDGVWTTVPDARIIDLLQRQEAQAAAERLVQAAISAGGPDNATAVVVYLGAAAGDAEAIDMNLPSEESSRAAELSRQARSGQRQRLPWILLLGLAAVLGALVLLQRLGIYDAWDWLRSRL